MLSVCVDSMGVFLVFSVKKMQTAVMEIDGIGTVRFLPVCSRSNIPTMTRQSQQPQDYLNSASQIKWASWVIHDFTSKNQQEHLKTTKVQALDNK